ncbi:hypothetical protein NQ315_016221 [Exocentrus adspersus]|uniref:Polyprotein n=1 Tax=Exocentrus adspersus TaxID=1586481 RepID=A0AAV8VIW1_9CUCU|nr:hypothetical protein NQ315_016221 [Exocentrus adspersus]
MAMSAEQFQQLLQAVMEIRPPNAPTGSFSKCTARFNGERSHNTVDNFITTISIYKDIEKIEDADALKGLPLLLTGTAATWWQGVKNEVTTWNEATTRLRIAFSPAKPAYQIYLDIFNEPQKSKTPIDEFICNKRALLAQLPMNRHDEATQIDLVYGLLDVKLRKEVPRSEITSFTELLTKARQVEAIENESHKSETQGNDSKPCSTGAIKKKIRCNFCHFRGHTEDKGNTKQEAENVKMDAKMETSGLKSATTVHCYGCGKAGFFRSNCPDCSKKTTLEAQAVHFYSINTLIRSAAEVPTIPARICGIKGQAHIDTAAKTSIAGAMLYKLLQERHCSFVETQADITLADGRREQKRTTTINLVIMPDARDNRTLLGIDFLEKAGIVLNLPQRCWNFADEPDKLFEFVPQYHMVHGEPNIKAQPLQPTVNRQPLKETTNICATEVVRTSPFLEFFASPLPDEEVETIQHSGYLGGNEDNRKYCPEIIDDIFRDSLPVTYSPAKRAKYDLFMINVTLLDDEATNLSELQKSELNHVLICSIQVDLPSQSEKDIREGQLEDPALKQIINDLENIANEERNQKWINRGYFLHKGILYRYTDDQEDEDAKLVIPSKEIKNILYAYHDKPTAGHYGIDKTMNQISRRYYWNKMRQDIAKHVTACLACQRYKISNKKPAGLMQTHVVNQRFEVLAVDLFGPLPQSE